MQTVTQYENIADHARRIGVSRMTAYRYVRDGKIRVLSLSGRMVVQVEPERDREAA